MSKILIIDDEPPVRKMIGRVLHARGHQIFEAGDGLEGLEQAAGIRPDLILLDIGMPKINGLELCRLLKSDPKTATAHVLFLTGEDRLGVVEDALKEGASGYVVKPFDLGRLAEKIDTLLAGKT
jgi:CheY-like chemotaxis protein